MMYGEIVFQLLGAVFFLLATKKAIFFRGPRFFRTTALFLGFFFGLLTFICVFNLMRGTGFSNVMEAYEGYVEILIFPLLLFSLYNIKNDLALQKISEMRAVDKLKAALLDAVNDSVFLHDLEGRIEYVNHSAAHQLGYRKDQLQTFHFSQVVTADAAQQVKGHIADIRENGTSTFNSTLLTNNGAEIPIEVNARLVEAVGKTLVLSICRDTTERMRMEEERVSIEQRLLQAQKMESLGTLAGGVAHDFNNILVPIIGYSDLLLDSLSEQSKEYDSATKILQAAERARDIVQQILSFSRVKTEQESVHPVFVHLVLKEVMVLIKEVLPSSVILDTRISSCAPVISTASQMHRVCLNLITNAYQALEGQPGTVSISLKEVEGENLSYPIWLELSVADTGKGMSEAQQKRIFEPYFTTKKEGVGTGLGLSVVEGIVRDIGGNISVESTVGEGTKFTMLLPGADEKVVTTSLPDYDCSKGAGKLMVVDDEKVVGMYLKEVLENAGYEVSLFLHSPEALAAFKKTPEYWDLIISDYTMPQMTGDDLAASVRAINKTVGFIICSGFSGQLSSERMKELNINSFILKPLRPTELLSKIYKSLLRQGKI